METEHAPRPVDTLVDLVVRSHRIVVFTGAGISTESGIPDFRSPGGIWDRYTPVQYQDFLASEERRRYYWRMHRELYQQVRAAQPNEAHLAIATLDRMGKLDCVVTQNVDFLHQRAGVPEEKVIEIHGTVKYVNCLGCAQRYEREAIEKVLERGVEVPRCEACAGILKPATIAFGQAMPEQETNEAIRRARACDLFIVIGSSLVVYPAADMPIYAKEAEAALAIVNMTRTPLDGYADAVVCGKAGPIMAEVVARVKDKLFG
ncbi:MAG: Sir2 family NAD-dependent protein deacetylase [Chloroflexi bacterium]|nr:Sir2 family NAD-dependent protein deacetylase [Chloroflexota bacterium]